MTQTPARDHCTFCDIIKGAAEVSVCHEDADAIAFMDIQPVNNGHVLVVPREHYESLFEVPADLGVHLFRVTMSLAGAIRKVARCDDINIIVSSGEAAGQDEPHYHIHIIPRRENDGFDIPLPFGGSAMPDRTLLDAYAARIGAALRDPMKLADAEGVIERTVAVATFREAGVEMSDPPSADSGARGPLHLSNEEGPHGELQCDADAAVRD
jgi:histidine triad (HIT) family protein